MNDLYMAITILKLTASAFAFVVILYWHLSTKGTWKDWPAGRSLMALLAIIAVGYAWRGVNRLVGDYPLEEPLLLVLYCAIVLALAQIGLTIRRELRAGRARVITSESPADNTGPVAIILATTTTEEPNDKP